MRGLKINTIIIFLLVFTCCDDAQKISNTTPTDPDSTNNNNAIEYGGEQPPLLQQFETDMVSYGIDVGEWQATRPTPTQEELANLGVHSNTIEQYQDAQYYDGLFTHIQVKDYIQENNISTSDAQEYLDNAGQYIAKSLEVVRDNYVLLRNGVVADWRRFPKGLYYHYQSTKDQASYDAVIALRDGRTVGTGNPGAHPDMAHASWIREMSYWLQAHIWAEKLDGNHDAAKLQIYIDYLENHFRQIHNNEYTDPSRNVQNFMQSLYMGLAGMALIEWYELYGNRYWPTDNWETIPDALKDVYGWMMDQGPDGAKIMNDGSSDPNIGKSFWIEGYNDTEYGLFRAFNQSSYNTTPYTDIQNLITPIYYWIGMHFNDEKFIVLGDKVFAGAVHFQSFSRGSSFGKRYGQQYSQIFKGLRWRQEYIEAN